MKIDVVCLSKRVNCEGPLILSYETVRIPSSVKILNRKTVQEILKERVERRRALKDYWDKNWDKKLDKYRNNPFIDDHSDRVLVSWSPIITTDALNFICERF